MIGISITKSTSFRGAAQEFTNTYFYINSGSYPDQAGADSLIDQLKSIEVGFHAGNVTFLRGRLWKQTGDKATSEMISQKNLSGTGSNSAITSFDKERAFLFRIRAGNDSRGNAVYFRKWYHSCGNGPGNVAVASPQLDNTAAIAGANRTTMENAVAPVKNIGGFIGGWEICAKSGRRITAGAEWTSHNFLEHHQLGDMWRAQ